jgi:hypothetical protein
MAIWKYALQSCNIGNENSEGNLGAKLILQK